MRYGKHILALACGLLLAGCALSSRDELTVANPQGSAGIANFRQTVTTLERLTGVRSTASTELDNYVRLVSAFLSEDGKIETITPMLLLVNTGVVGAFCVEGVNRTITRAQSERVFLTESLVGIGSGSTLPALTAERGMAVANELADACLLRQLRPGEALIVQAFIETVKGQAGAGDNASLRNILAQLCTLICASFDALRI